MRTTLLASLVAVAAWPVAAHAQQPVQPLPPLPAGTAPAPAPGPPPPPPPQAEAPVDVTSAPPVVVSAAPPPPPPAVEEAPAAGPCGGEGAFKHDGFCLRAASGPGFLGLNGTGPSGDAHMSGLSSSTMIGIGGTPGRGFVLAGTIAAETLSNPSFTGSPAGVVQRGWTAGAARLGGLVDWFPNDRRGGHVGGILALHATSLTNDAAGTTWGGVGFGAEVFGGYDFWIGPEWSLGIQGGLSFSPSSPLKDSSGNDSGYSFGTFAFSAQATLLYH